MTGPAAQTIGAALAWARQRVAAVDARILLSHVLGAGPAALAAHPERHLTATQEETYLDLVQRRAAGEPVAYLTGTRAFYDLDLAVDAHVLIPRPETELLVDLALALIPEGAPWRVLDLGTGSGAIALAVARHRPATRITGVDVSAAALATARRNAARLLSPDRPGTLEWVEGSWFAPLGGERYDLVLSNPPYVATDDPHLRAGDLRFEPKGALAAGPDGLDALRVLAAAAPAHLAPTGWLLMEHGFDQGEACRMLLRKAGLAGVETHPDLAGLDRVTGGRLPAP